MTETLTREQIEKMPAGAEMDCLLAERVMKWQRCGFGCDAIDGRYAIDSCTGQPLILGPSNVSTSWRPSVDVAAVWEVVEKMLEPRTETCVGNEYDASLDFSCQWTERGGWAQFFKRRNGQQVSIASGESMPEIICQAALLATLKETS